MKRAVLFASALACLALPVHGAPMRSWATTTTQAGNTVSNTTSATLIADQLVMDAATPNNQRYGQTFSVDCFGVISTPASASGTLDIQVVDGHGNGGLTYTALGDTGAFTPAASLSSAAITLHGDIHFSVAGSSAIATFTGDLDVVGASNAPLRYPMRPSGTSGVTGWSSTFSAVANPPNVLGIRVTWGSALTTDSITFQACRFQRVI